MKYCTSDRYLSHGAYCLLSFPRMPHSKYGACLLFGFSMSMNSSLLVPLSLLFEKCADHTKCSCKWPVQIRFCEFCLHAFRVLIIILGSGHQQRDSRSHKIWLNVVAPIFLSTMSTLKKPRTFDHATSKVMMMVKVMTPEAAMC